MVRGLLTDDERRLLFAIPADQEALIQHYTLAPDEIELTLGKRGARNRLGLALQLCLLRHPGFGLSAAENVPDELLRYLGAQLGVPASVYLDYSRRSQTRSDHGQELAGMLGLYMPGREDIPLMIGLAAAAARETDRGVPIVAELMAQLRSRKFILPAPDTLERAGTRGRARARRLAADALVAPLTPDQLALVDALVINDTDLGRSRLSWLRDVPESPSAGNLIGIIDRLEQVRTLGLNPALRDAIHENRFRQFAREGAVAPAFLLTEYSARRRRATLIAQMIERESTLSDAAVEMFDKLVGSMFTRAKKRKEERYQGTTRDVGPPDAPLRSHHRHAGRRPRECGRPVRGTRRSGRLVYSHEGQAGGAGPGRVRGRGHARHRDREVSDLAQIRADVPRHLHIQGYECMGPAPDGRRSAPGFE
jgi:hypothetical protein